MSEKSLKAFKIPEGTIHRTIGLLRNALNQLNAPIEESRVEEIGILVHLAMSRQNRKFHTPEHIFNLADPGDPHISLAALFHDVVYYQVDRGFLPKVEKILSPYLVITKEEIRIRDDIEPSERTFFGTAAVFGFSPGQILSPFAGLNEFLSTLLMNSFLEGIVREQDLLVASAAIEMTIPFRPNDKEGRSPSDLLEQRIRRIVEEFGLGLSEEQIRQAVVSAVRLGNRDISNFAEEDPAAFLDNTWKLLPETNPELFVKGLYSIRSYATALKKMEGFLSFLDPDSVFQQYAGYPDEAEYEKLLGRTSSNLHVAADYLGIKMISAGILLALAELTGGDTPISFFMGEMNPEHEWCSLNYHLPDVSSCPGEDLHKEKALFLLLKVGRAGSSEFDLQNSPLSLFIYCHLNDGELEKGIQISRDFLSNKISAHPYLEALPPFLVEKIARAASVIAFTRREKLQKIAESFS